MKKTSVKTILVLGLLISSGCLLVWAGSRQQEKQPSDKLNFQSEEPKPWDSLSAKEQQLVQSYWNSLRRIGTKTGVQQRIILSTQPLENEPSNETIRIDTTFVIRSTDWMLFQSADVEMVYTPSFSSVLDRVQESVLVLPPVPVFENTNHFQQPVAAVKPEDYFISIDNSGKYCKIILTNPEHLNLTSIELIGDTSTEQVNKYRMINPNYSAEGGKSLQYDVQIEEKKIDERTETELLQKLWIQFSNRKMPEINQYYKQFSVTNLLEP